MKRGLFASAIALAFATGSAFAADLPSRKAPVYVPPPPLTWTGAYLGVDLGGVWLNNNPADVSLPYWDPNHPFLGAVAGAPNLFFFPNGNQWGGNGGLIGGGHDGYNLQLTRSIVIGYESDIAGTTISGNATNLAFYASPFAPAGGVLVPAFPFYNAKIDLSYLGTVRGRAGWLFMPELLVYGTAGFAYGGVNPFRFSGTATGWTAGGGLEWRFKPNWSAKLEYLYVDLNSSGDSGFYGWNWGSRRNLELSLVRVGVSYHFEWTALFHGPVVAAY